MDDMVDKSKIKSILAFIVLLLFGQFIFAKLIAEPYPSIVFPGFAEVNEATDTLNYGEREIYCYSSRGDSAKISLSVLFQDIPATFRGNVLQTIVEREKIAPRFKSIQVGIFTYRLEQSLKFSRQDRELFYEWIYKNLSAEIDFDSVSAIKVFKYRHKYDLKHGEEIRGRTLTGIDKITLLR